MQPGQNDNNYDDHTDNKIVNSDKNYAAATRTTLGKPFKHRSINQSKKYDKSLPKPHPKEKLQNAFLIRLKNMHLDQLQGLLPWTCDPKDFCTSQSWTQADGLRPSTGRSRHGGVSSGQRALDSTVRWASIADSSPVWKGPENQCNFPVENAKHLKNDLEGCKFLPFLEMRAYFKGWNRGRVK